MNYFLLWLLLFFFCIFFRQEISGYLQPMFKRRYLMICLVSLALSDVSYIFYAEFQAFLRMMMYQILRLKNVIEYMVPLSISAYVLHVVIIATLVFSYARFALKHQSLIYKEQVALFRQAVYVVFLMLMVFFSFEYDLTFS